MVASLRTRLIQMNEMVDVPDCEDDLVLIERARHDPDAFATLYRRYVDAVYRYCYRRLDTKEAAEDATSRVFIRVLGALPRYRKGPFRSWLFTIAHNVIANDFRTTREHRPLGQGMTVVDSAAGPEEQALAHDARQTIHDLLAQLPPNQRRLLELRLGGLSGPEIAQVLGKSHGAVKVAQFRAMTRLRELAGGDDT